MKEAELDNRDRLKEKDEIEELKNRIFSGEHEDPNAEFERYILQQAAQELAAVEAEPIDSDSDMDDNHYSPPPPEPENNSVDASESAQIITKIKKVKKDKDNSEKKTDEKKIPTEKEALFAYKLDWGAIDNGLMEKKIRPWINKKIIEYIGEPEPTLVDFICSKVLAGSQPQVILEDVQMVLDEEAEVFIVKMWRLLIYEVEAKKLGLVK
ncbi:hypothetical protein NQ318_008504 [Aromia moschata]|uniref:PWI domain-containing protein n=1 Tax=Aromia moschata TaxID=1265417 RepID=A0AAV8X718_9CUCU|nr:hypothetical protein NQ318_008504 [Aromia moschata]